MKQRGIGQKISFVIAIICYMAAIASLIATFYWGGEIGTNHPVVASLGASVAFFICVGIVLHVIGRVSLPNLKIDRGKVDNNPPEI